MEAEAQEFLKKLEPHLNTITPSESLFWRARIGYEARLFHSPKPLDFILAYQPYSNSKIGAPPPPLASTGRINRQGVSYLYLASDADTAAAEIRPHPGHVVSLGAFRASAGLKTADFGNLNIDLFSSSDERLKLFHLGQSIDWAFGSPVV